MASAARERPPVRGRLDETGRLVEADPELEALQRDAGGAVGQQLAIPQLAVIARLAGSRITSIMKPNQPDRGSVCHRSVAEYPMDWRLVRPAARVLPGKIDSKRVARSGG